MAMAGNSVLISIASEFDAKGIREAQRQLEQLEKNLPTDKFEAMGQKFQEVGDRMKKVGKGMTLALTLPLVGITRTRLGLPDSRFPTAAMIMID